MIRLIWVACVALFTIVPTKGFAYSVPTEHILKQFIDRCKNIQDASVYLTSSSPHTQEQRVDMKRGELFKATPEVSAVYQAWAHLLTARGSSAEDFLIRTLQLLKKNNINTKMVTLSMLDGNPVYVMGAHPWQTDASQVWFDKEQGVPVKIVLAASSGQLTFTHFDAGSCIAKEWLFEQKGSPSIVFRVSKTHLNTRIPDTYFAAPAAP